MQQGIVSYMFSYMHDQKSHLLRIPTHIYLQEHMNIATNQKCISVLKKSGHTLVMGLEVGSD